MSLQWKVFKQRYYRKLNTLSIYRRVLLSGKLQSEHFGAGEVFIQRYYWNVHTLSLCRRVLLSGNVQSEYVAAEKMF